MNRPSKPEDWDDWYILHDMVTYRFKADFEKVLFRQHVFLRRKGKPRRRRFRGASGFVRGSNPYWQHNVGTTTVPNLLNMLGFQFDTSA